MWGWLFCFDTDERTRSFECKHAPVQVGALTKVVASDPPVVTGIRATAPSTAKALTSVPRAVRVRGDRDKM